MTQTPVRKVTFAEFLDYDAADHRIELENGEIITMPTGSPLHIAIIRFLFTTLENEIKGNHLPFEIFPGGIGVRTGLRTSREPDLCILHREEWDALRKQNPLSAIVERPPLLVVEVVSPGNGNRDRPKGALRDRDYHTKRREYAEMGIPEYWIVDPEEQKMVLCVVVGQSYQLTELQGQSLIRSTLLPQLVLRAEQLFNLEHPPKAVVTFLRG
ncbi:Uma2 family endonuclease [Thermosynechococcus sp. HY213]|uniref:Uma2 family endonuclease n=3 Tax=Thermosynechococcus TaxID=146785 RepID=UPI0028621EB6|nr:MULTISPECIES: Uma2 family endonuclease [unclassified Thermosynechococcus]MDR5639336.1 Uma2 family endonuclease [Thermosynechococcus sp. PP42]MDR7922157.1 Uma2 family endonuclease [Thermosynechococcus sp. HY213]